MSGMPEEGRACSALSGTWTGGHNAVQAGDRTRGTGIGMWAQLITMRLKPDKQQALPELMEQLRATEQPGSGLLRSITMQDQHDPTRVFTLVVFDSEQSARERENDPRRTAGLQEVLSLIHISEPTRR